MSYKRGDKLSVLPSQGHIRHNVEVTDKGTLRVYWITDKHGRTMRVIEQAGKLWYMSLLSAEPGDVIEEEEQ